MPETQKQSSRGVLQKRCFWGLRPATSLKKRLWHRCFPVNFVKFLRAPFLIEHLRWLLPETAGISICLITLNIWQGFEYASGMNMLRYSYNNIIIIAAVITLEFLSAQFLHRFLSLWLEGVETLKYRGVCRPPYGKV